MMTIQGTQTALIILHSTFTKSILVFSAYKEFGMRFHLATLVALFAAMPAAAQPSFKFFEPVQPARAIQVVAHRGMQMLAPENSINAVLACAADYVEWAKIDVRLTKDGRHVVIHDDDLDRCTDGKGKVVDFSLEDLKKLDAGSWFAPRFKGARLLSLPELLTAAKGKVNLCLDCKRIDPELLAKEILATGMEMQVVVYDNQAAVLAKVRAVSGNKIPTIIKFRPKTMTFDAFVKDVDPAAVEIDADDVTAELCKAFHVKGIKVQAKVLGEKWDKPAVWAKMFDAKVDWLQTDDPVGVRFADVRRRIPKFPVKISYHRGANRYAPENTIGAIQKAAALGADYIEIDIRPTKDGKYVLLHDSTLNRTTNGQGALRESTFADLAQLSAGAWYGQPFVDTRVPSLADGLTAMGKQSHAYLDAKDITPADLLEAMRKHDLVERSVIYQSKAYLAKLKMLEPKVRPLPPLGRANQFEQVAAISPYGFDANWSILSQELIEKSHKAGILVFSDALGNEHEKVEEYQKAIGWGIDVIQTDHPMRVLRAIELMAVKSR
jgi:glycerophosphoryl diester phosphodiesterase